MVCPGNGYLYHYQRNIVTLNNKSYGKYSSCPLVTGYGKMALTEFNYKNEFTPDPMQKYMLPYLYRDKMRKGKM